MKISLILAGVLGLLAVCQADAVRLKIVGPDGKPVAGAAVRVFEVAGLAGAPKIEKPLELTSDAGGEVAFESKTPLPAAKEPSEIGRVYLGVQVRALGLAIRQSELKAGDNTLALRAGHAFSGIVLDENEKPVAGVKIQLRSISLPGQSLQERSFFGYISPGDDGEPNALSDASGKWVLDGLPLVGTGEIGVADPRFKNESFAFDLSKGAPPLFLERGATLKGRLLKPDGTGASDVRFYVGNLAVFPKTGADGRFEIGGLGSDDLDLQAFGFLTGNLPFLVPTKHVPGLQAGEVRDIGDWQTKSGIHVRGKVVEAGTNKPLEGANIEVFGEGDLGQGTSGKDGTFDFVASPDNYSVSASMDGFVGYDSHDVPNSTTGVIDVGTITLKRGLKIKGVVKNQAGTPVVAMLYADKNGSRAYARSDEKDGSFTFDGLEAGDYTVGGQGQKIVAGEKFSVSDKPSAPLSVVVEGKDALPNASQIAGRVLDESGHPIAGAKIRLKIKQVRGYTENQTLVSGLDGTYSAPLSSPTATPEIAGVSRPGWIFGGAQLILANAIWRGDITLQKRGVVLRGRILDSHGAPVAGAYVGLADGYSLPVVADANGAFILSDAPARGTKMMASDGPRLLEFEVGAPDVSLVLPDVSPLTDKGAFADSILASSGLPTLWEKQWNVLGARRIETILAPTRDGRYAGSKWNRFLRLLVQHEPQTLLDREAELRQESPRESLGEFERLLMLARAMSSDETERAKVKSWLDKQQKQQRDLTAESVKNLLGVAEVAARLDAKQGAQWLDFAAQIAAQLPDDNDTDSWGELAARISDEAPVQLTQDRATYSALQLLLGAMRIFCDAKDMAGARKTFARMEELGVVAAKSPKSIVKGERYYNTPAELVRQGRQFLARVVAPNDADAALQIALADGDETRAQVLLDIARSAVKQKHIDIALSAINAALTLPIGGEKSAAEAATIAAPFDPAFSETLFARAFKSSIPKDSDDLDRYVSVFSYAKARAGKRPGESRILIEREWKKRVAKAKEGTDDYFDINGGGMQGLAEATALIAPRRALEMTEQIRDKRGGRAQARGEIALALLGEK